MKFELVGSHLCKSTLYAIVKCEEAGLDYSFTNITASLSTQKRFLSLYANADIYQEIRESSAQPDYASNGRVGIPCFVFEDGFMTLSLEEAMKKAQA